jgi:hypothetical protein
MSLIILLIAALIVGYWLSRSKYSESVDETAGKVTTTSVSWAERAGGWWQVHVLRRPGTEPFLKWAAGGGKEILPEDLRVWLEGLSEEQGREFVTGLDSYANGLGYNLNELVEGGYEGKPALVQVFVEAIVVYSQEYRKAREVEVDSDGQEKNVPDEAHAEEVKPAQKRASRRKRGASTSQAAA